MWSVVGSFVLDLTDADWHNIWVTLLGGLILGMFFYGLRFWRTFGERMDRQDDMMAHQSATNDRNAEAIAHLRQTQLQEFGGNSGGIRERINSIDHTVNRLVDVQQDVAAAVAKLEGRFDMHVESAPKKRGTK